MFTKTQGLVLREMEYLDTDKLLTVLTKELGKITVRARGVRRKSSPLKTACQLLCFSEFTLFQSKGKYSIQEANAIELFLPLRGDLDAYYLASYFVQVTDVLAQEDAPFPELLSLTLNAMFAISKLGKPFNIVKPTFELRAASIAGFTPVLDHCAICGFQIPNRFNLKHGVLQCESCHSEMLDGIRMPINESVCNAMRFIVYAPAEKLFSFSLGEASLSLLNQTTEAFLSMQLEKSFFTLDLYKSLQINALGENHVGTKQES